MNPSPSPDELALYCSTNGEIIRVFMDSIGLFSSAQPGESIKGYLPFEYLEPFDRLLDDLAQRREIFRFPFLFNRDNPMAMVCHALLIQNQVLMIASTQGQRADQLLIHELVRNFRDQTAILEHFVDEKEIGENKGPSDQFFADFRTLNNQLMTLQEQVDQQNMSLQDRNTVISLLAKMGIALQRSDDQSSIYSVLHEYAVKIFGDSAELAYGDPSETPETIRLLWKTKPDSGTEDIAATFLEQGNLTLANFRLRNQLREQAMHDPLTGLYNRRTMYEVIEHAIGEAKRESGEVSLILFDLDHFKQINDRFGHPAGDKVLEEVSAQIVKSVREYDWVCRFGGEEFIIIIPGLSVQVASQRAERIRALLSGMEIVIDEVSRLRVTVSGGVAGYPRHGTSSTQLIEAADAALYKAKAAGRNQIFVARP